jgi:hypothetical protein
MGWRTTTRHRPAVRAGEQLGEVAAAVVRGGDVGGGYGQDLSHERGLDPRPRRAAGQRGSNENTNGLLRQYFPKGTSLRPYTQTDLDAVAAELNGRPRKTLGYSTPSRVLSEALR